MIKGALIETVRNEILKQSSTQDSLKQAHPKDIEYAIAKVYSSLMKQYFSDNRNLMDTDFDFYCKKYTLSVSYDIANNQYYVTLPVPCLQLKANMGIRSVRPEKGKISFERTTEDELETYRDLEAYTCGGAFYYKDGMKIMFDYVNTKFKLISSVVVKMIINFEDYAMTDNIEFPASDAEFSEIILKIMGVRPTDSVNDDIK